MKFAFIHNLDNIPGQHITFARQLAEQTNREFCVIRDLPSDMEEYCEAESIDMLFISCRNQRKEVQQWLNKTRDLRLPYVFLTDTMNHIRELHNVVSPVSMLEEEVHKAETLTHLARFTGAEILLLQAHDYGSRAKQNTDRISTALMQFDLKVKTEIAKKDSFSVGREAAERQKEWQTDLLVITASREYGLDDLFFGPQERHIIRSSNCPVLLLNPRGDLFSLCD